MQTDVTRSNTQFLERPDVDSISDSTRDLISTISVGVCREGGKHPVVDLTHNISKCADPERAEVFGECDLCY